MKTDEGRRTIDGLVITVDGKRLDEHYDVKRFTKYGFEWTYEGEVPCRERHPHLPARQQLPVVRQLGQRIRRAQHPPVRKLGLGEWSRHLGQRRAGAPPVATRTTRPAFFGSNPWPWVDPLLARSPPFRPRHGTTRKDRTWFPESRRGQERQERIRIDTPGCTGHQQRGARRVDHLSRRVAHRLLRWEFALPPARGAMSGPRAATDWVCPWAGGRQAEILRPGGAGGDPQERPRASPRARPRGRASSPSSSRMERGQSPLPRPRRGPRGRRARAARSFDPLGRTEADPRSSTRSRRLITRERTPRSRRPPVTTSRSTRGWPRPRRFTRAEGFPISTPCWPW